MMNSYTIKYHSYYASKLIELQLYVGKLHGMLTQEDFNQNETVKFLARLHRATKIIIPSNPNNSDYYLKGPLSKFRRFKQGLRRYRLIFCFASKPPVIVYLYINDRDHLRKQGDKNDPYGEFMGLLKRGIFSHDPLDPRMAQWIQNELE